MNKKAYGLVSLLVVCVIMSCLSILTLNNFNGVNLDKYYFIDDYLLKQSLAIANNDVEYLNNNYGRNIYFNNDGKVNMGQTITFNNGKVVIHIGNGYLTYE